MGWSCSWIAAEGIGKEELLDHFGLVVTGQRVGPGCRQAPMSISERPNGWTVIFSEDFDWAAARRIEGLSRLGLVVGCQFEDKVDMASAAWAMDKGVELWRVSHRNEPGHDLNATGRPPAELASIHEEALRAQREDSGADYLHEVPMALAAVVCGYRADECSSPFEAVRPAAQASARSPSTPSFLERILAPLKGRRDR